MAETINIGGTRRQRVFIGTDWTFDFYLADYDADPTGATAKDMTGMALSLDMRLTRDATAAVFTKVIGAGLEVLGVFDPDMEVNTQLCRLSVADDDITVAKVGALGGKFPYSFKRMTSNAETILGEGVITVERATQD